MDGWLRCILRIRMMRHGLINFIAIGIAYNAATMHVNPVKVRLLVAMHTSNDWNYILKHIIDLIYLSYFKHRTTSQKERLLVAMHTSNDWNYRLKHIIDLIYLSYFKHRTTSQHLLPGCYRELDIAGWLTQHEMIESTDVEL